MYLFKCVISVIAPSQRNVLFMHVQRRAKSGVPKWLVCLSWWRWTPNIGSHNPMSDVAHCSKALYFKSTPTAAEQQLAERRWAAAACGRHACLRLCARVRLTTRGTTVGRLPWKACHFTSVNLLGLTGANGPHAASLAAGISIAELGGCYPSGPHFSFMQNMQPVAFVCTCANIVHSGCPKHLHPSPPPPFFQFDI